MEVARSVDLHELAFYVGLRRDGCHVAFPRTRQSFQFVERLLRVGLRESHGGERHQNNRQHETRGISYSILLTKFIVFALARRFAGRIDELG